MRLSTGQRATVRQTLTRMEADTSMLFVAAESLRVHLPDEYLHAVRSKLAEAVEAMRQLKLLALESDPEAGNPPASSL